METRTRMETVTFRHPFQLPGLPSALPAGDYLTETDEEQLTGMSFVAFRRIKVLIYLHQKLNRPGLTESVWIEPSELDAALEHDATVDAGQGDALRGSS